ncbi:hypothetical protein BMWSH_2766 [Priestia megaterium WSH-002]|uniref:Uncharacterized protein n=1 Tax=Priestia megaterium (strain WSH-002) TaxID=1006007 RepID=A0A8D4BK69_PRIMW|nr:hypothetical protein BMWSH_2766 [Priestia megaterium WSH-002]
MKKSVLPIFFIVNLFLFTVYYLIKDTSFSYRIYRTYGLFIYFLAPV